MTVDSPMPEESEENHVDFGLRFKSERIKTLLKIRVSEITKLCKLNAFAPVPNCCLCNNTYVTVTLMHPVRMGERSGAAKRIT